MRGPDGETPRGTGGEPGSGPLYRPPWSHEEPGLPWYKRVTRKQWYLIAAIIVAVHGIFGYGFFWRTDFSRAERMRNTQKAMTSYQYLPPCLGPRVNGETLVPDAPLAVPDAVALYGLTGTVGLGFVVGENGRVSNICLAEPSGNPGFDNAMYASAKSWRFQEPRQAPGVRRLLLLRVTDAKSPIDVRAWVPAALPKPVRK